MIALDVVHIHGHSGGVDNGLLCYHGAFVRAPQRSDQHPRAEFLGWHRDEVFKGRPREVA